MRAVVVELDPIDGPELLGRFLTDHNVTWDHVRLYQPHEPIDLDRYDVVIGLGGVMNADETEQ